MKIFAISLASLLTVLAVAGCNPVGMDDTRAYVTGIVWEDAAMTIRAPGVGIATEGTQTSYATQTNANGVYWIEIQFYPELLLEQGGSSGSMTFGLRAHDAFGSQGEI